MAAGRPDMYISMSYSCSFLLLLLPLPYLMQRRWWLVGAVNHHVTRKHVSIPHRPHTDGEWSHVGLIIVNLRTTKGPVCDYHHGGRGGVRECEHHGETSGQPYVCTQFSHAPAFRHARTTPNHTHTKPHAHQATRKHTSTHHARRVATSAPRSPT